MNNEIYIVCPPSKATGGPEALHQLGYVLNQLGFNVKMLYSKYKTKPIHPFYERYNVPYVFSVKDSKDILLIIPESMTNLIAKYPLAEKKVWWLSLDFYDILMKNREEKRNYFKKIFFPKRNTEYRFESNPTVSHLYQSERVRQFLLTKPLENPISYLCDYPTELFFEELPELERLKKEDIITYNPKKGLETIKSFKDDLSQYEWIPLTNMTREEIRIVLRKAKLHVDFGYFPGRDKIPREALVSGCCLLTGRDGTSAFKEDLGIPEKFKLHQNEQNPENIKRLIIELMNDYENIFKEFIPFREFVIGEKRRMFEDVKKLFS